MNTNQEFSKAFEKYMLLDKKTLAELLAMKEVMEKEDNNDISCPLYPYAPTYPSYPDYPTYPYGPIVTYCVGSL